MLREFTEKEKIKIKRAITEKVSIALRDKLKCSKSLISHYRNSTKVVSPERAIIVQSITGIPASILRPDIFKQLKS